MKSFAASLLLSLAAAVAFGQAVDLQVLKRAQRVNDQNNARQGLSAPPGQPSPAAPPRPDPTLVATLQNITNLQADFVVLANDPAKKQPLMNDLNAAAQGGHPSNSSVSRLAEDLAAALAGKHLSPEQLKKLAQYVHAVFNSHHLTPLQEQVIFEDVQKILSGGGVSSAAAAKVVTDMKACAAEIK